MINRRGFHFILLFIFVICPSVLLAQTDDVSIYQLDTAEVKAIRRIGVSGMERFGVGRIAYKTDSLSLSTLQHSSLTDYISKLTPVYIRESGNGMMASVSLRGTASSHTVTTWNGLTINSLTMGQTDFNHLPVFFFDEVAVYPGGEGALYGNGAIGGSISLKTGPQRRDGIHADIQQTFGSYTHSFSGGKLIFNKGKWSTKTSLLYNYCKNNFTFRNAYRHGFPTEKQNNASFNNFGALQEIYFRPSARSTLSARVWYMKFYREIQPMMSANNSKHEYDTIRDRNFITQLNFNHRASWAQFSISGAYLYDRQLFRKDIIATNRLVMRAEAEKNILKRLVIKAGTYVEHIIPDVQSYQNDVTEWRGDVYVLLHYAFARRWEASLNLRQSFVSKLSPPFTPSTGLAYRAIDGAYNQLKLRATVSKSFRAPTLNDRYWGQSGNMDLKPEKGINLEGGIDYTLSLPLFTVQAQASVYHNNVDNWILWQPRGHIWKPTNLMQVKAKGIELSTRLSANIDKVELILNANYSYVNSKIEKGVSDNDPSTGLQLPLLPQHRWNISANATYKNLFALFGLSYTGVTYSSDRNMPISSYMLAHMAAGYNFNWGKHKLALTAQVNNLFNKVYESVLFFAMPKRNWNISLRYII